MAKATIRTLTPVHIGNGEEYQHNFNYLYFQQDGCVAVIDDKKILDIIGKENISHWVTVIDKQESLLDWLHTRKASLSPDDVARKSIPISEGTIDKLRPIREQMHSGNGEPIVPGSSLKGALKTVLWAHLILKDDGLVKKRNNLGRSYFDKRAKREKFKFGDKALTEKFFGKDPNHDLFRLLKIADAHFTNTICFNTEVVNWGSRDGWYIKEKISQLIEAVPAGETTEMAFQYNELLAEKAKSVFNENKGLLHPDKLLPLANEHTKRLINKELKYWKGEGNPNVLGTYLDTLNAILEQAETCQKNECIFRLGWGTGYHNMTGGWISKMDDDDFYDLIAYLRPKHPEDLVYPKTLRMIAGGQPLGYVKLSM